MEYSLRLGIVQERPGVDDVEKCLAMAQLAIATAAENGVDLLVFGESWMCGYPAWLDHCSEVARWDHDGVKEVYARMYANSLSVNGEVMKRLQGAAAEHGIHVVMGMNEVVEYGVGNGTIYNAIVFIDDQGQIVNHHRKLMPTFTEKLVHGMGDGQGLKSVAVKDMRVGGLICWEHWMPLARQAMHDVGEDIHLALWPMVKEMHLVASQQYAFEGRCYVVSVGQIQLI